MSKLHPANVDSHADVDIDVVHINVDTDRPLWCHGIQLKYWLSRSSFSGTKSNSVKSFAHSSLNTFQFHL